MQYTEICFSSKNLNIFFIYTCIFNIFAQNIDCRYMYKPVDPSFSIKWGIMGYMMIVLKLFMACHFSSPICIIQRYILLFSLT